MDDGLTNNSAPAVGGFLPVFQKCFRASELIKDGDRNSTVVFVVVSNSSIVVEAKVNRSLCLPV